ncbi:hypothetical protein ACSNOK_25095, partial [Streptomyces sp. URMC 126]
AGCDADAAMIGGGGGGGSGFAAGPGVSGGVTTAGSGRYAAARTDPLYQAGIGDHYKPGQVVLQWAEPDTVGVSPGGPPEVVLTRTGETGYPGVRLRAEADNEGVRRQVRVVLPAGKGLRFVEEGGPGYQLTVQSASGDTRRYLGTLSADGQTLTFTDVDLGLTGTGSASVAWVAVQATSGSPLGESELTFRVGARTGASTTVRVGEPFALLPGGEGVTLARGGGTRYPGVWLRAERDCTGARRDVRVVLPAGRELRFVEEGDPGYQLTVDRGIGSPQHYSGSLSADGQTLTFTDVGLGLVGTGSGSAAWVAVQALAAAPLGTTGLTFHVGGVSRESTSLHVIA